MRPLGIGLFTHRGFSLIEILVVLFILSLSFGFGLMAFGDFGKSREVALSAQHLQNVIRRVREEAILEAHDYSIRINTKGYQTFRLNAAGKLTPHEHPRSTSGHFPNGLRLHPALMINIHATGMITPFQLHLGTKASPNQLLLTGSANGHLTLKKL